ncbi:PH domain-containing protein [Streptomyces sp. L500]
MTLARSPGDTAPAREPAGDEVPWQRLHGRLIWVNAVRLVLSTLPTLLSMLFLGADRRMADLWPAVGATTAGVLVSVADVVRWMRTRYRITEDLVEIRTGRVLRVYRQIPRDRIRAVDSKARLRHRLAGLRVVFVSAGRSRPSVRLDAVTKDMAIALQRELMPAQSEEDAARETVIARIHWSWVFHNVINVWGMLVGALLLWSADSLLQLVGLDLIGTLDHAVGHLATSRAGRWALWAGVLFVFGFAALLSGFVAGNWGFRLVRTANDEGTTLLTRQGLLSTREVRRDDRRLRGMHLSEPLFWRWMGLTETAVISTGLATWSLSSEAASNILPRAPIREARRVAALVLPGPERPLEAPLRRHPRAALYRRLLWAALLTAALTGLLSWLAATDAVPGWAPAVPLWASPLTLLGAVIAFRSLGHTATGGYLVLRRGLSRRQTAALRCDAVLGLKVRQTLLQRALGLVSIGTPTAAGERFYHAPDLGTEQFLTFAREIVPEFLAEFLEPVPPGDPKSVAAKPLTAERKTSARLPGRDPGRQ